MLENLLDTTISFYRDTFEILKGSIPVSSTYTISFDYDTYFSVTATPSEDVIIYLTGGGRTEAFNFYTNQEETRQGEIAFTGLTGITSTLSAAGGTVNIITTNSYGKPLKSKWLVGSYKCRALNRSFIFPYTPLGETDKAEVRVACASTAMVVGDIALYDGQYHNVTMRTPISGLNGFSHAELVIKRR